MAMSVGERTLLFGAGGAIAACLAGVRLCSSAFVYAAPLPVLENFIVVALMIAAGLASILLARVIANARPRRGDLIVAVGLGLAMRLLFFGSTPILEDDWRRYLWDGASLIEGVDPYAHPPADALGVDPFGRPIETTDETRARLIALGAGEPEFPETVNYPYLTTIYPGTAQLAFAAAAAVSRFDLDAWRGALLLADGLAFFLMIRLLDAGGRARLWSLLYWWNPLLIVTAYNMGHMDLLLAPCLLAALLARRADRPAMAGAALGLAVGVKIWPLLLAPVLFIGWLRRPRALLIAGGALAFIAALLLAPMILALADARSGLAAYSLEWRRFAFLFPALVAGLDAVGLEGDRPARLIIAGAVSVVALAAAWRVRHEVRAKTSRVAAAMTAVAAALYFLSPTGYPWYAIWVFVFLPFAPSYGLAALAASLPLYYLRYYFQKNGMADVVTFGLAPAAFGLPLVTLIIERIRRRG